MKNDLLFDFIVDKSTNTVFVNREFAAELSLVWDAFTTKEILDQWWAPKPWMSRTKSMDFKVGGRRFYAMVSPEGQDHWSIQDYTSISPTTNFKYIDAFADKDGIINTEFPSGEWNLNFGEQDGTTIVKITIKHKTLAGLEQLIQMGFKEGFTMTLNELEILLSTIKKQKK
ncbi:MAG: SRPBCC domain-containing protein [Ferruginibacter sp.]